MKKQEFKIGFGENGESDSESEIIIHDSFKKGFRTLTVKENGKIYYQQTIHISCAHEGTETFLDKFLQRFNSAYEESERSKRLDNVGYVGNNGTDLFYLISKARLQSLNLKQKFFHFLLKQIFFHGETASLEQISRFCVDNHIE